jgi:hypothetical protein
MKVTDEILNKLIDNELNDREIEELHRLIKYDEVALSKVKAHQMVDSILKKIDIDLAPEDTTPIIMERISNSLLIKERKNGFFKFIIASFIFMIIFIIGYLVSISGKTYVSETPSKYTEIIDKFVNFFASFNVVLDSELMLIIGGVLTVMLLISGYFMFEEHRSFKHKLENYL